MRMLIGALRRVIRRIPLKPVAVAAVPLLTVVVAMSPVHIGLAVAFGVTISLLAALGMAIFDLRRRLITSHHGLMDELHARDQHNRRHHAELQRSLDEIRHRQHQTPRRMNAEELIRLANTYAAFDDQARLGVINDLYLRTRFMPLTLGDPHGSLRLDNLKTAVSPAPWAEPAVSVIMPVRNAESTIGYALRSVLAQTWRNLQVIVVDDASTDGTAAVAEKIAAGDPRVLVVRRPANGGVFAARNTGLAHATGDLVTTHDADDWSHAQTMHAQVEALADDNLVGAMVHGSRCTATVELVRMPLNKEHLKPSFVSLMLRRSVFDEIGWWDEQVRCGGDAELLARTKAFYGQSSVRLIADRTPLTLHLQRTESLTSDGVTGLSSFGHALGARSLYQDAFKRWHTSDGFRASLPWLPGEHERPFPAPRMMMRDEP